MQQRKLKFRIWNTKDKVLLYPEKQAELAISLMGNLFSKWEKDCHFENWVIQQFTGLLDKNNKEIYEGDIVKYNNRNLGVIEYGTYSDNEMVDHYGFHVNWLDWPEWNVHFSERTTEDMEIIGNIFENPELIK